MPSQWWNPIRVCSASDEISSAYAQHGCTCVHILPLAELAQKFVPRMLSVQWNRFLVCSVCDKIVSTFYFFRSLCQSANCCPNPTNLPKMQHLWISLFAQHAHAIIFENYSKYQIKMQILTINNRNFGKPSRNPSYRTKVKVLRENLFLIAHQKNLIFFRLCSVTAKMCEHQNSGKNPRKRIEICFENWLRVYKVLI